MIFGKLFGKFSQNLGIDLGTSNTRVYAEKEGVVINEPSFVAINTKTDEITAIGVAAKEMLGKTPPYISIIRPLVKGIISDFEVTEKMLKYFFDKTHEKGFAVVPRPRVVIGVPLDLTEVERKAVEDATLGAGAREVFLVEEVMAGAIGARLPIRDTIGNMIVDVGGGNTEIAVISLSGVVNWRSLHVAGEEMNKNIIQYARDAFNLLLGEKMAEETKIKIGSAIELAEPLEMQIRGRDLLTGLPREMTINDTQIREALAKSVRLIVENIKATLETTPPELVADIYERGIVLAGGGAMLKGLDRLIAKITEVPVRIADDPATCVVRGTGILLEDKEFLKHISLPSADEGSIFRS